ncbi:Uncharacterised protein [Vibrio cholerae]|nr:Uncharacterised protein [Vibrio cholerae]
MLLRGLITELSCAFSCFSLRFSLRLSCGFFISCLLMTNS